MRRREIINIWPAIADLMTVLAVPALCVSVGRLPYVLPGPKPGPEVEIPKNERMYRAIQRAQDFVGKVEQECGLKLEDDQTLRFGDDLVSFERNSFEPIWKANSRQRLRTYCAALSATLKQQPDMRDRFQIVVEGHADASICHGSSNCNWWISASRAAAFVVYMRQAEFCREGASWALLPTGFAATRPIDGGGPSTRRIALRLIPDYKRIIDDVMKTEPKKNRAGRP